MSISERKHVSEAEGSARRLEIFTGTGRRRAWSAEEKASILAESREDGISISEVARRHGLTPQQLFAWRRQAKELAAISEEPPFVPLITSAFHGAAESASPTSPQTIRPHVIELDVLGASVFIWRDADPVMVTAIIGALKAAR
jgi:transposase